jgi:hypothetical protein
MTRWTLVFGLIVAAATAGRASESVAIRVSPAVAFAPADLVIRTRTAPDAHNRALAIVADSDSFYRSSSIQLDGDRAPLTTTVTFHSVPAGEYNITASLIGSDGHATALAHTTVMVVGSH